MGVSRYVHVAVIEGLTFDRKVGVRLETSANKTVVSNYYRA